MPQHTGTCYECATSRKRNCKATKWGPNCTYRNHGLRAITPTHENQGQPGFEFEPLPLPQQAAPLPLQPTTQLQPPTNPLQMFCRHLRVGVRPMGAGAGTGATGACCLLVLRAACSHRDAIAE